MDIADSILVLWASMYKICQILQIIQFHIQNIEMEKVPQLEMFSSRHLKKSSSLSRLNHHDSASRPTSSYQYQANTNNNANSNSNGKGQNYYGQALQILNIDSRINNNLNNIEAKYEGLVKKGGVRKFSKNQIPEQSFAQENVMLSSETHIFMPHHQVQASQVNRPVSFNFGAPTPNRISESNKSIPFYLDSNKSIPFNLPQNNNQSGQFNGNPAQMMPQQFAPTQQFQGNFNIPPQFQMNRNIPGQMPPPPPSPHRGSITQSVKFRDYSQPDKIFSSSNIPPTCNNEQEIKYKVKGQQENKAEAYTFRDSEREEKGNISLKKTCNPFLFDATYLLDIKESESRLPDIAQAINLKEYNQEFEKKKDLLEQLTEIKESNMLQGQHFLNQLDSLILQFADKQVKKVRFLDESEMRSSRRSLFSKIQ